jgi:hypothetical protein
MFSVFISKFDDVKSNIMFGDFNEDFIEGGEENLTWFDLTNDTEFQIYLSWANLAET